MQAFRTLMTATALGVLAACQTLPDRDPALDVAEREYRETAADPAVQRHAAADLARVRGMLTRAQRYYGQERNLEQTRHLSYLASRELATLRTDAARRDAEEQIRQAGTERERLQLQQAREAELARARSGEDAAQRAAREAQDRAASLQRDLAALDARRTQRGIIVMLRDMLFATGRAELQPGARRSMERLSEVLRQHPERRIQVEGFTDSTGGSAMNQRLSEQRAAAVRSALVQAGIATERIEVRAFGEDYPVADNATAAGRQQNRRVEIIFSDERGQLSPR